MSNTCGMGGFGSAVFSSTGDIRFSDHDPTATRISYHPGLASNGAIEFDALQLYVASRRSAPTNMERPDADPGFLVQSGKSITVRGPTEPSGAELQVPLSFGERLTMRAPDVTVGKGGVVRAPQGQIRLGGVAGPAGEAGSVTLEDGSLVSTSLEGATVPFGQLQASGLFLGYDQPGQAPSKSVTLSASRVAVNKGAVIDVSGSGDLQGFTLSAGVGGSADVLAAPGTFAVLPSLGARPAPIAGIASLRDGTLSVGDSVWLEGVPGLTPNFYTLLPAHYALLPGGLLVRPLGGASASALASIAYPDGSVVASGYRAIEGTSVRDPGYGRFLVMSSDAFHRYSQIDTYSFNEAAGKLATEAGVTVRTANDAGNAVLKAGESLMLSGTGRFGAGAGGLIGNLDIAAKKIAIVGTGATTGDLTGYLLLDAKSVTDFGAGSLLIGGTRSTTAAGTAVDVVASDVVVRNDSGSALTGPEMIFTASGTVAVSDGSVLRAASGQGATSADTSALVLGPSTGALLRLSSGSRVVTTRPAAGATSVGTLSLGHATLEASGSLTLEASQSVDVAAAITLSSPQLDLASQRVNLGDGAGSQPGTTLGKSLITRLASSSDLLIRGYQGIYLSGDLNLGSRGGSTLPNLTLDSGLLQGEGGQGTITCSTLTLRNSNVGAAGAPDTTPAREPSRSTSTRSASALASCASLVT